MGKILKPLAIIAAVVVNVIPGVGQALSAALVTAITSAGITAALGYAASALGLGPKSPDVSPSNRDRLFANVDPSTPRKLLFGKTAMATDIRYQEWTGTDQEYLHQIVCVASHKVTSIDQVWLDDELAWSNGAAVGKYAGYLTISPRLEGGPGNTVTIGNGAKWGASRRMTGLAYLHMRFKVTGNSKKKESPFGQKIPSRMTVIGDGMPVYDPRFDSTNGGAGPMLPDDETTWAFTYNGVVCGRNPANQLLTYLLGWRIANPANGTKKLAVGRGIPASRFDFAKWITAANACDEAVALATGGTEPRYQGDGVFSEADDPRQVIEAFETTMNAKLRDTGGRYGVVVLSNDLGTPTLDLDDDDVLGEFRWNPKGSIDRNYNEIRGRFTDPRTVSLYQLVDYPRYRETPLDGIERVLPFDLPLVQSPSQAQRLVKQQFARLKYQGKFEANLGARAWALQLGDVVRLTFSSLGWGAKLFRVVEHGIKPDGVCPVVLQEEHPDIYLWDRDERPPVQPVELVRYDPANSVLLQLLVAGEIDYSNGLSLEYYQPAEPGANVTGLHTSANTNMVGDRTSDQVNNDLNSTGAAITAQGLQLADIIVNVDDLRATYGDTAAAAASASAAAAAQDVALQARDQAQEFATNASGSATAAGGSASQALAYRDAAGEHATSAAGSSLSARTRAAAVLPATLEQQGAFFTDEGYGNGPATAPGIAANVATDAQYGPYYSRPNLEGFLGTRGVAAYEPGKAYDIEAQVWTAATDEPVGSVIWLTPLNSDYTLIPELASQGGFPVGPFTQGVVGAVTMLAGRAVLPVYPTAKWLRFGVLFNRQIGSLATPAAGSDQRPLSVAVRDATQTRAAETAASASATSASAAAASQTAAGNSAASATTARNEAVAANGTAQGAASAASASAASADAARSIAENAVVLAAQASHRAISPNPNFAGMLASEPFTTAGWDNWFQAPTLQYRVPGYAGGFGRVQGNALGWQTGLQSGIFLLRPGHYVLDYVFELMDGTPGGAGIYLSGQDTAGNEIDVPKFPLIGLPDVNGQTVDNAPGLSAYRPIRGSKLFQITNVNVTQMAIVAMTSWAGFDAAMPYKQLGWHYVGVREASEQERLAGTVLPALQASVAVNASAIATLNGRTTAFWQVEANAGLQNGATAFISARAETSPGVVSSTVAFGAREIHLYNPTTAGWVRTLSVFAGEVVVFGSLTASAGIYLGTGVKWQVALRSKEFSVTDGTPLSYGLNFGTPPLISFRADNLAPLNTGETYRLYADASTGSGFTPRLRISTPGTTTNYNLTVDSAPGTGPTRQIDKGANPDAPNNRYSFSIYGTFSAIAAYETGYN